MSRCPLFDPAVRRSGIGRLLLLALALLLPALAGQANGRGPSPARGFAPATHRLRAVTAMTGAPDRAHGSGRSLPPPSLRTSTRPARALPAKPRAQVTPRRTPQPRAPGDPLQIAGLYDFDGVLPAGHLPSGTAIAGKTILAVSDWYGAISTDGGATFRQIDMQALFQPTSYTAWTNREPKVAYLPSINRFVCAMAWWIHPLLMEGISTLRIAVATPEEAANDTWTYWDFPHHSAFPELFPASHDIVNRGPNLGVGDNYLYFAAPTVDGILVPELGHVFGRIPLAELVEQDNIQFQYIFTTTGMGVGVPQHLGSTAHWGALLGNDTLRVFSWPESSETTTYTDYATTPWVDPTPSTVSPNLNWLGSMEEAWVKRRLSATLFGNDLWLAWTVGAEPGDGRPHTHVRVARLDLVLAQIAGGLPIHSGTFAVAFPALAANADGEVAYAAYAGGGNAFPSLVTGMLTGNTQAFPVTTGDHGPVTESWLGPTIQRASPFSRLFLVQGYSLQGGASNDNADRKALLFGRSSDIPDSYEPDDTYDQASLITDPQTHSFHQPGDQDWARIELAQPTRIVAFTSGNSTEDDTELTLYDASLAQVDYDDDDGADRYSRIETGVLQPGTYYVRVNEWGDNERIGQYYLTVQLVSGYLLSGTVTLDGAGFGTEVRLYSNPTMTQQLAAVQSNPSTGYWEYRAEPGNSFFIKPFKSGFTFSAGWFQENIQSDLPGLNFTASPASPPAAPTGLTGVGISDTRVLLAFNDQANNETGFQIRKGTAAGGPFMTLNPDAPEAPSGGTRFYMVYGLSANTNYWFQVRALPQQDSTSGWVTVGPVKTQKAGKFLLLPGSVKIPKKGKVKVGQSKSVTVKVQNPFPFPIPVGATTPPTAPFGMTPASPVIPASSSGPLNLTFSFTPTTGTPSTQTQQITLTLLLPGAEVPVPITLQGSAK